MKILIIKLGYSETFIDDNSRVVSLGDVLRTTPILEGLKQKYPNSQIDWLVSAEAYDLINESEFIEKTMIFGKDKINEKYDILVNLEKFDEIFEFINQLEFTQLIGFCKSENNVILEPQNDKIWQELIFEMLGLEWNGQKYSLGYKPKSRIYRDVGLNYLVGSKWPTKAMSMKKWENLANSLDEIGFKYSWQEGKENLKEYIEWINSCETIITQDSLGLHIAMALGKNVVALFGATEYKNMYFYGHCKVLLPKSNCDLLPCYKKFCDKADFCMNSIDLDEILDFLKGL